MKKNEIRKSETFVNYDAEGKKIIRIYSFMRKVKKNEPNVEDIVLKKLRENSKNLKEYFPAYPFRSGLQKADGFLHYSPMCEKSLIESIGGFQLPLTQAELAIIDKTVGSRELSDIKCFLIQKCNNQNTESLSWNEILDNLKFWFKQTNSQRKTNDSTAVQKTPAKQNGGQKIPDDLIDLAKAVSTFHRSRAQLKRDIDNKEIKSYRKKPKGKHYISESEANNIYLPKDSLA